MLNLLKSLDLSWEKTRPAHPKSDPRAQADFKNLWPAPSARGYEAASDQSAQTYPVSRDQPVAKMELRALRSS
jgi:hypothetical protein